MISWSARRKLMYISVISVVLFFLIAVPAFFIFYKKPSCFDGVKNQDERGIDCGGSCQLLCTAEVLPLSVIFERFVRVSPGVYSVVAYVENPNLSSGSNRVPYSFKLYDNRNVLLYERKGAMFIPPGETAAIFEAGLITGDRLPGRIIFEFSEPPIWQTMQTEGKPELRVIERRLTTDEDGTPRLKVVIKNISLSAVRDVEVVAVIFDEDGNVLAASKTRADLIKPDTPTAVFFTWREPFAKTPVKIDIMPQLFPGVHYRNGDKF